MTQALMTAGITVLGGFTIFVLGQVFVVLFLERIRMQARTIEEVAQALVMYAREYSSPIGPGESLSGERRERLSSGSIEVRRVAAALRSTAQTLKWYSIFEKLGLVLPRRDILEASKSLVGISNLMPPSMQTASAGDEFRVRVEKLLKIYIEPE